MSKIVNENYKITLLDNGYLVEFKSGEDIRKFCCKTRDEVKEFILDYLIDEVNANGYAEMEAKIKV